MTKLKRDLTNITISILVDFDKKSWFSISILRSSKHYLSMDANRMMVQAFITTTSWLDWCNSLYYGITDEFTWRLQSVQNAAARLITGTRWCDHISPVLRQLHWKASSVSAARASRLFLGVSPAMSQATWLTTADSSPTLASDNCVLLTLEHWSSVVYKVLLATEHSLQ